MFLNVNDVQRPSVIYVNDTILTWNSNEKKSDMDQCKKRENRLNTSDICAD